MEEKLAGKLSELPKTPGVYFHKDKDGQVIYIGKAANLRNRVQQYFQNGRIKDPKTDQLVAEIHDIEWIQVETELDALFLEAELVRRYLPKYNILLRDDKSLIYIRINYKDAHPTVTFTRRPLDDGAEYYGPYFSTFALRKALSYLRKVFPYSTHSGAMPKRVCLQYHLGLCPGLEEGKTTLEAYRANLRKLMQYLKGGRQNLMKDLEKDMKNAAKNQDFETAAKLRNQLLALEALSRRIIFSDKEHLDISKDQGMSGLADMLGLKSIPTRIEGYDISHMQGTNNVASMVVFKNGVPDKASYRKFKLRIPGNNDFAHMEETIIRRLKDSNKTAWPIPDLFLIDGGKGQLSSAISARNVKEVSKPMIGLAKREEEIIVDIKESNVFINNGLINKMGGFISSSDNFVSILLPKSSPVVKLLQRIRDESHRFAISYHSTLKVKSQTSSILDEIPGVGVVTRKKLLRAFGSVGAISKADPEALRKIVGTHKSQLVRKYLNRI